MADRTSAANMLEFRHQARFLQRRLRNLRVKLETDPAHPRYIVTVRGTGYRFDP